MEEAVEVVEAVEVAEATAAVAAEATAAQVEWEEAGAEVDTAGLRCRVVAMAGAVGQGTCLGPAATGPVVWLRTGMSPEETSTDPKPPPRFNPVRKVLGQVFLRLLKETGLGPARAATKGSPMLRIRLAAANSLGKLREPGAANLQAKS